MKDWLHSTKKEIDNMTLGEACEIVQKHIDTGEKVIQNPRCSAFAPRPHMTKALKLLVEQAKIN